LTLRSGVKQGAEGACRNSRHVSVQNQDHPFLLKLGHGLLDRMACSQLPVLYRPNHIGRREALGDRFAAMSNHNSQARWRQAPGGLEDVKQHWPARQRVQHLGKPGVHALALASGQDDDLQRLGGHRGGIGK
jgi:hypothetical protein